MVRALRWCVLLVLLGSPLPCGAQTELSDRQFDQLTQRWHQTLDSISADLRDLTIVGDGLAALRENIRIVEESAAEAREEAAAAADEQQALLDAIGPAPDEGEPVEDEALAAERSLIADRLSSSLGRVARSNVVLARVRDLLARTVEEETAALLGAIEESTVSPLMPGRHRDRLRPARRPAGRAWRHDRAVLAVGKSLRTLVPYGCGARCCRGADPPGRAAAPALAAGDLRAGSDHRPAERHAPVRGGHGGDARQCDLTGAGDLRSPGCPLGQPDHSGRSRSDRRRAAAGRPRGRAAGRPCLCGPCAGSAGLAPQRPDRRRRRSPLPRDLRLCAGAAGDGAGLVAISPTYAHGRFFELAGLRIPSSARSAGWLP